MLKKFKPFVIKLFQKKKINSIDEFSVKVAESKSEKKIFPSVSKIIGSFIFEISKENLELLLQNNIDNSQYQIQRKEISKSNVEYRLIFTEKKIWIGDFLISSNDNGGSTLSIKFTFPFLLEDQNEDDFCITKLRELCEHIIGKLKYNENIIPINYKEGMDDLYRAFLYEEQQEVEKQILNKEEKLLKEGIYSREFFSEVVRTQPEIVEKILNDYKSTHLSEPYWQQIEVKPNWISPAYYYMLALSGFFNFGYLAEIKILPINDIESRIIIRNYSDLPFISESDIARQMYFQTIEELKKLSSHFYDLFFIRHGKMQINLRNEFSNEENKINKINNKLERKKPGAKRIIGFDEAFEKTLEELSDSEAFDWWAKNYPEAFQKLQAKDNYSTPLECFKAGMKYRRITK